ncbi:unnamed protein product [Albugo candida]|uniref:beta-glucosidase n=1 Tax=Albugo candida TaxID=65357 RepID=A0A024G328_9STRA|nr:unnamed protein product [Albugo candida]|eukprot:CCI40932.1 unnamed protein product [Albugo candida]
MLSTLYFVCGLGAALISRTNASDSKVDAIFKDLTLDNGLGQLFQLEAPATVMDGKFLNLTKLEIYAKLGIGSYLNNFGLFDKDGFQENLNGFEIRNIIDKIMNVSLEKQPLNPILYGLDSVHGANFVGKATIFPAQINIGATFDVKYAFEVGVVASNDTAAAGAKWVLLRFWTRLRIVDFLVYKKRLAKTVICACPKHFLGYQETTIGYDRTNVELSMFNIVNTALKPFIAAIDAGALSIMESYSSLNTLPMVDNEKWLRKVLRDILQFKGVLITDYKEVQNLVDYHHTASNYTEALKRSIRAGVDISMIVDYSIDWIDMLKKIMKEDPSMIPFVETAIKRVIYVKNQLNLYDQPYSGKELLANIGSQESIDLAIQVARDSIVLLRNNDSVLPFNPTSRIFLTGNAANNAGGMSGGWSHAWQGQDGNDLFKERITILDGLKKLAQRLTYTVGLNYTQEYDEQEVLKAQNMAKEADVCVVALAEHSGVEKPFDIDDLALPLNQTKFLDAMKMSCKKLVLVLVQARPRTFPVTSDIHAILNTMLVGPHGGQAIAEILMGLYNPNGRQVVPYSMKDGLNCIPYNAPVDTLCGYGPCVADFPFGFGLSYTKYVYSNLRMSTQTVACAGTLTVKVDVSNQGSMAGREAVLLFIQQKTRSHVPEIKNLKSFDKISLAIGETKTVTFELQQDAWTYLSPKIEENFRVVREPGAFFVAIKYDTLCKFDGSETNEMCGAVFIPGTHGDDSKVDTIYGSLSAEHRIGQLFQLEAASTIMDGEKVNQANLLKFAQLGIGSYLNNFGVFDRNGFQENLNGSEIRQIIDNIMDVSLKEDPNNPILYGLDSVHGANFVGKATIFPAQINIGSTFDVKYAFQVGEVASNDTAGAGSKYVFGPVADVALNKRSCRIQETFGQDSYLVSRMTAESVKGIQNNGLVTACLKHFLGYQHNYLGYDRVNVEISDFNLVNTILQPFIAGIDAGALSIMQSYSSVNTLPMVDNAEWLHTVLRDILHFKGVVITDYKEGQNLVDFHHTAENYTDALKRCIKAGVDISMVVDLSINWIEILKQILKEDPSMAPYVEAAVKRVIYVKNQLNLYDQPYSGKELLANIGSQESIDLAIQVARDSIVLLRNNDSVLPLNPTSRIFLTGNAANNAGGMSGGWSHVWQGQDGNDLFKERITILDGLKKLAQRLTYTVGLNYTQEYDEQEVLKAQNMAKEADVCVVALAEHSGVEKPFDIDDLALPLNQTKFLDAMKMSCKKLVLVLVQARPRTFPVTSDIHAILNTMLVGPHGGQAIAEILMGLYNPNGRQVVPYSMKDGHDSLVYNAPVDTLCGYGPCVADFPFGFGLSYTKYVYSNLRMSTQTVACAGTLTVKVDVSNQGSMAGREAVLLFIQQKTRSHVPEIKNLKSFDKISLAIGETKTVTFELQQDAWTYLSPKIEENFRVVCEPGAFFVAIKYDTLCEFDGDETNEMCGKFTVV